MSLMVQKERELASVISDLRKKNGENSFIGLKVVSEGQPQNYFIHRNYLISVSPDLGFRPKVVCHNLDDKNIFSVFSRCLQQQPVQIGMRDFLTNLQCQAAVGDSQAIVQFGRCNEKGLGMQVNLDQADALYKQASDMGNIEAKFRLFCLHSDNDSEQDMLWLNAAAAAGHVKAQRILGTMLIEGERVGMEQDIAAGIDLLERAFDQGDSQAAYELSLFYQTKENHEKATFYLMQAHERGNLLAEDLLERRHHKVEPEENKDPE